MLSINGTANFAALRLELHFIVTKDKGLSQASSHQTSSRGTAVKRNTEEDNGTVGMCFRAQTRQAKKVRQRCFHLTHTHARHTQTQHVSIGLNKSYVSHSTMHLVSSRSHESL